MPVKPCIFCGSVCPLRVQTETQRAEIGKLCGLFFVHAMAMGAVTIVQLFAAPAPLALGVLAGFVGYAPTFILASGVLVVACHSNRPVAVYSSTR